MGCVFRGSGVSSVELQLTGKRFDRLLIYYFFGGSRFCGSILPV